MAQITHIPCDPEYLREKETPRWYDGILPTLLIVASAIAILIGGLVK